MKENEKKKSPKEIMKKEKFENTFLFLKF